MYGCITMCGATYHHNGHRRRVDSKHAGCPTPQSTSIRPSMHGRETNTRDKNMMAQPRESALKIGRWMGDIHQGESVWRALCSMTSKHSTPVSRKTLPARAQRAQDATKLAMLPRGLHREKGTIRETLQHLYVLQLQQTRLHASSITFPWAAKRPENVPRS
jgi:hypothetical protein